MARHSVPLRSKLGEQRQRRTDQESSRAEGQSVQHGVQASGECRNLDDSASFAATEKHRQSQTKVQESVPLSRDRTELFQVSRNKNAKGITLKFN